MYKRVISLSLCILMVLSTMLCLCSCKGKSGNEYPVTIGNTTINEEPLNIVVLSDCMADIISYMRYDVKMVGRSIETDQEFLSVVPIVGTAKDPNVDSIISYETDLVIAEEAISEKAKTALSEANIPVLTLKKATTTAELEKLYLNLGTALGGNVTGKAKGKESYDALFKTLNDYNDAIPNDVIKTACYLYMDKNGILCTLTKGSIEFDIFSYCGATNIFSEQTVLPVNLEELKIGTPSFIFYDNEAVMDKLKEDPEIAQMSAIKEGNTLMIDKKFFDRQGVTYEETLFEMIEFMFIEKNATPDEATKSEAETTPQSSAKTQSATQSTTQASTQANTVGYVE